MNNSGTETKSSGTSRYLIVGVVLLVLLPIVLFQSHGELDRWRAAAVIERYLDGNKKESIEQLRTISSRLPTDYRLQLILGEWLLEDRQAGSALELARAIPEAFQDARSRVLIQHCLLAQGHPGKALQAYREANPANESRNYSQTIEHKNSLSYFQGLAGEELELALTNANYVVGEASGVWNYRQNIRLGSHHQVFFCAASVYRFQMLRNTDDDQQRQIYCDKALKVIGKAIEQLQLEYDEHCQKVPNALFDFFGGMFGGLQDADITGSRPAGFASGKKEELAGALAEFWTLRALLLQESGRDEESFRDRRSVIELGFQPEQIAEMFPAFGDCTGQLQMMAMFLDTRGCVHYKIGDLHSALADLNTAVMAQQALLDVADSEPRTSFDMSLDPRQQAKVYVGRAKRTLAALLLHRSWAARASNDQLTELADQIEIRKLGFEPDSYLF